jgi:predicted SAM-dependent methyltransferase
MWLYLQNCTNILNTRLRVLHFSPEFAIYQKLHTCPNLDYITTDFDPRAPLTTVRMDITQIPYSDNTVDAILCSHVLPVIPDDRKAISELHRILKPGGWALLPVPFDPERAETFEDPTVVDPKERRRLFGHPECVRIYGRDFKDRLESAGFTAHQVFYARDLGPGLAQRYGLQKQLDMFYCVKPA